jgi:hypothetical protein
VETLASEHSRAWGRSGSGGAREGGGAAHYATFPTFPYGLHLLRDICSTTSIHKRMIPPEVSLRGPEAELCPPGA